MRKPSQIARATSSGMIEHLSPSWRKLMSSTQLLKTATELLSMAVLLIAVLDLQGLFQLRGEGEHVISISSFNSATSRWGPMERMEFWHFELWRNAFLEYEWESNSQTRPPGSLVPRLQSFSKPQWPSHSKAQRLCPWERCAQKSRQSLPLFPFFSLSSYSNALKVISSHRCLAKNQLHSVPIPDFLVKYSPSGRKFACQLMIVCLTYIGANWNRRPGELTSWGSR